MKEIFIYIEKLKTSNKILQPFNGAVQGRPIHIIDVKLPYVIEENAKLIIKLNDVQIQDGVLTGNCVSVEEVE